MDLPIPNGEFKSRTHEDATNVLRLEDFSDVSYRDRGPADTSA